MSMLVRARRSPWSGILLLGMLCCASAAWAQTPPQASNIMLFGIVEDERSGKPLQNTRVRVYTDSIAGDSVFTDALGKYQLFVPLQGVHRLEYAGPDHHRKLVEVDANGGFDAAARAQEWNLRIDIDLLLADVALPDELLDTPIGKAAYVSAMREFQWDQPYTERYKQRFKQELKSAGKAR